MKKDQLTATKGTEKKTSPLEVTASSFKQQIVKPSIDAKQNKQILTDLLESYYFNDSYLFEFNSLFSDSTRRSDLYFDVNKIIIQALGLEEEKFGEKVWDIIFGNDTPHITAKESAVSAIKNIYLLEEQGAKIRYEPFSRESIIIALKAATCIRYITIKISTIALKGDTEPVFKFNYSSKNHAISDKMLDCILSMINNAYCLEKRYELPFEALCNFTICTLPFDIKNNVYESMISTLDYLIESSSLIEDIE